MQERQNPMPVEAEHIKSLLVDHLDLLDTYIRKVVPQKGNTTDECQLLCIIESLTGAARAVNSLEAADFVPAEQFDLSGKGYSSELWAENVADFGAKMKAFEQAIGSPEAFSRDAS